MSAVSPVQTMIETLACAEASVSAPAAGSDSPFRQAVALAQAACDAAAASSSAPSPSREDAGLPPLSGSAADVSAAMVIRARALRRLRLDLAERIREEASARWWIDHRHQVCG